VTEWDFFLECLKKFYFSHKKTYLYSLDEYHGNMDDVICETEAMEILEKYMERKYFPLNITSF